MNTKFFFTVLVVVVFAAACAPLIPGSSAPLDPIQPPSEPVAAPATAPDAVVVRAPQEPRLWSGEILLSDTGSPDYVQNAQPLTQQPALDACVSEDDQPKRQSGCVE